MREDWISPWWQASCLPQWWRVAGVRVPSLSVWHVFVLEQLANRFVYGMPADRDDVASLLLVASRDRAGFRRLMLAPNHRERELRKMHRQITDQDWDDLNSSCEEYVQTCVRHADAWTSTEGNNTPPRPYGSPLSFRLVATLCGVMNYECEQAWNESFALAVAYHDTNAEAGGQMNLLDTLSQELEDIFEAVMQPGAN